MGDRQYHLKFDGSKAAAVDEYLEYRRIVGDDDGGECFTPEQYEDYKKKVIPQRMKNRLYTSFTSSTGMDCKMVGPETPCFCQHRYKQHKTDFENIPASRPIKLPCKVSGCKCATYHYVPLMGSTPIRCTCKHPADEHSEKHPYQCKKSICQKCAGFKSSYTCACGQKYGDHTTIVETREEREARGHPTGQDVPYQAMGGLTGFSSLAEGYLRMDPSGRGAPSQEFLQQEITSNDHTFLKANVPSIQAYRKANKNYDKLDEDLTERMSQLRKPGEQDDMDYFERRYQEREKSKAAGKKAIAFNPEERPRTGARKAADGKAPPRGSATGSKTGSKPGTPKTGGAKGTGSGAAKKNAAWDIPN